MGRSARRAGAVREALETKAVSEAAIGLRLVLGPIARVAVDAQRPAPGRGDRGYQRGNRGGCGGGRRV